MWERGIGRNDLGLLRHRQGILVEICQPSHTTKCVTSSNSSFLLLCRNDYFRGLAITHLTLASSSFPLRSPFPSLYCAAEFSSIYWPSPDLHHTPIIASLHTHLLVPQFCSWTDYFSSCLTCTSPHSLSFWKSMIPCSLTFLPVAIMRAAGPSPL